MRTDLQGFDAELARHVAELDEHHRDTRGQLLAGLDGVAAAIRDELAGSVRDRHLARTRRTFLRGGLVTAGVVGGGLVAAACGADTLSLSSSGASASLGAGGSPPTVAAGAGGDLQSARLAASLEVLAVGTYTTVITAAGLGAFGAVPPAFGSFATTVRAQHQEHGAAWNAALQKAGQAPVTAPNPRYNAVVQQAVPTLKTIADVARLALQLETVAAETYVAASGALADKANRGVALTIAPVEAQHIAVLNFILGTYPVPDGFMKIDMAADVSSLTG